MMTQHCLCGNPAKMEMATCTQVIQLNVYCAYQFILTEACSSQQFSTDDQTSEEQKHPIFSIMTFSVF